MLSRFPRGRSHAEGIFQPAPVLHRGRRQGVENDAAVKPVFSTRIRSDTGRESQFVPAMSRLLKAILLVLRKLLRMLSRPAETRSPKSGRTVLSEIHIDVLRADLLRQHPGAPGRGGGQRIERFGGGERERQIAGGQSGAGGCGVGAERDVCPADAVRAVFAADYDAVQRETCGHAAGIRSGSVGVERERSADLCSGVIPMSARSKSKTLPDRRSAVPAPSAFPKRTAADGALRRGRKDGRRGAGFRGPHPALFRRNRGSVLRARPIRIGRFPVSAAITDRIRRPRPSA